MFFWSTVKIINMKKITVFLLTLIFIGGVCVVTCPDKQAHQDAIMNVVNSKLSEQADEQLGDGFGFLGASIGSSIVNWIINNRLEVKNCFAFSLGQVEDEDGKMQTVSVGVLGHVFTTSKEEFSKTFDEFTE